MNDLVGFISFQKETQREAFWRPERKVPEGEGVELSTEVEVRETNLMVSQDSGLGTVRKCSSPSDKSLVY